MTMLLTHKPEVTSSAVVTQVADAVSAKPAKATKAKKAYHKGARQARMKATLKTIIKMSSQEGGEEITIATLGARLKLALLAQIKKGELKESSIKADLNAAIKEMGGLVELRREKADGARGRPFVVYAFDASTLTAKGLQLRAAIEEEQTKSGKKS